MAAPVSIVAYWNEPLVIAKAGTLPPLGTVVEWTGTSMKLLGLRVELRGQASQRPLAKSYIKINTDPGRQDEGPTMGAIDMRCHTTNYDERDLQRQLVALYTAHPHLFSAGKRYGVVSTHIDATALLWEPNHLDLDGLFGMQVLEAAVKEQAAPQEPGAPRPVFACHMRWCHVSRKRAVFHWTGLVDSPLRLEPVVL
jgi:hypothetical protein